MANIEECEGVLGGFILKSGFLFFGNEEIQRLPSVLFVEPNESSPNARLTELTHQVCEVIKKAVAHLADMKRTCALTVNWNEYTEFGLPPKQWRSFERKLVRGYCEIYADHRKGSSPIPRKMNKSWMLAAA